MKFGTAAGIFVLLLMVASAGIAADAPKVSLEAQNTPIEQAMADIARQAGVQIVCDPAVKASISAQFSSMELEQLLDVVAKSNNLSWQKLYLPANTEQKPTIEQMRARAQAVAAVMSGPIVVCDPVTGKQKVFVEQDAAAPSIDPVTLGLQPIYLISRPVTQTAAAEPQASKTDAAARFESLQNERMKLLTEMTPAERVGAMQQEMAAMMYLDPATRQQIMLDQMNARRNMDPQMRDAQREIMRDTFRSLREQGLIEGRGDMGGGPRGRGDR